MVNTGKPSGGCKQCLARRIKCDETKPACLRCVRSRRECPGYRDPLEFKIRDETQSTIRKFKRVHHVVEKHQVLQEEAAAAATLAAAYGKNNNNNNDDADDDDDEEEKVKADVESWTSGYFNRRNNSTTSSPTSTTSSSSSSSSGSETSLASPIHSDFLTTSLTTPTDQQAACYLLSSYILLSDSSPQGGRRGYLKFAYKLLIRPQQPPTRSLQSAFKAVSYVALASRHPSLVLAAEAHYSTALREASRAIQDPAQVRRDDTLAAVLLLALYETLAASPSSRRHASLDEYASHIKGAAQLVRMRGVAALHETDEGAEMFSVTRNQFLALRSLRPSSADDDDDDCAWLLRESCPDAYVSRVATLSIACSAMRRKVDRALRHGDDETVRDLLREAEVLARKLDGLDQPQNAVWRIHTLLQSNDDEDDDDDDYDDDDDENDEHGEYGFHSLYVCMIYCIIWTSHLFLTTSIFRCMAHLDGGTQNWQQGPAYERAVKMTKRRVADIVAAMPYACSWNGYQEQDADFACGAAPLPPSMGGPPKGVAGLSVYRPAFTAMTSDYATPKQKRYLLGRLQLLADVGGIKQIHVLLRTQHESAHPSYFIERDRLQATTRV